MDQYYIEPLLIMLLIGSLIGILIINMWMHTKKIAASRVEDCLESLKLREEVCWKMTKVFLENKDPHGIHDMGVEIQALQRAITELKRIDETKVC